LLVVCFVSGLGRLCFPQPCDYIIAAQDGHKTYYSECDFLRFLLTNQGFLFLYPYIWIKKKAACRKGQAASSNDVMVAAKDAAQTSKDVKTEGKT